MHNSESHGIQQLLTNLSGLYINTLYVSVECHDRPVAAVHRNHWPSVSCDAEH